MWLQPKGYLPYCKATVNPVISCFLTLLGTACKSNLPARPQLSLKKAGSLEGKLEYSPSSTGTPTMSWVEKQLGVFSTALVGRRPHGHSWLCCRLLVGPRGTPMPAPVSRTAPTPSTHLVMRRAQGCQLRLSSQGTVTSLPEAELRAVRALVGHDTERSELEL